MANVRAEVKIRGVVQGVLFRGHTCSRAQSLKVSGWVRNLPDGSVDAVFEGDEEAVRSMVAWCHQGPPSAVVRGVDVEFKPYTGEFGQFRIT